MQAPSCCAWQAPAQWHCSKLECDCALRTLQLPCSRNCESVNRLSLRHARVQIGALQRLQFVHSCSSVMHRLAFCAAQPLQNGRSLCEAPSAHVVTLCWRSRKGGKKKKKKRRETRHIEATSTASGAPSPSALQRKNMQKLVHVSCMTTTCQPKGQRWYTSFVDHSAVLTPSQAQQQGHNVYLRLAVTPLVSIACMYAVFPGAHHTSQTRLLVRSNTSAAAV